MIAEHQEQISLYYRAGGSDKVYHVQLERTDLGFVVNFQFGRRNSTLQSGSKTPEPVSYEKAKKIYDKLVAEKMGKGYTQGQDGTPYQGSDRAERHSGILPQLLNPIDEEKVVGLIADDGWCLQEKKDGWRVLLRKTGDQIQAINRQGLFVPVSKAVEQAALKLNDPVLLDGELIGDVYWAFDLLELDGSNLRTSGTAERFSKLVWLLDPFGQGTLQVVPNAWNVSAKRELFERLKAARAEGVVFKRRDAQYAPGRPNSGGDQVKFKFISTATCKVMDHNDGKRSVSLGVYQHPGDGFVEVGNVTIPPNFRIPTISSLVDVRYLYAYVGGSLYQPVYLGERDDLDCADSVMSLKFKQGDSDES